MSLYRDYPLDFAKIHSVGWVMDYNNQLDICLNTKLDIRYYYFPGPLDFFPSNI